MAKGKETVKNYLTEEFFELASEYINEHPEGPLDNPYGKMWAVKTDHSNPTKEKETPQMDESPEPTSAEVGVFDSCARDAAVPVVKEDDEEVLIDSTWHNQGMTAKKQLELELENKRDRLDPKNKLKDRTIWEYDSKLKEIKYALEDFPLSGKERSALSDEIRALEREAVGYIPKTMREAYDKSLKDYDALCHLTEDQLRQAARMLDDEKFDDMGEMLEDLEPRKKEIEAAYENVLKEHEGLTKRLCDLIEYRTRGTNGKDGFFEPTEERREMFGMMDGENGDSYIARLIETDQEVPDTILQIDKKVAEAESRWQRIASLSPEEMDTVKMNWRKTMASIMKRGALASNMPTVELERLLTWKHDIHEIRYGCLHTKSPTAVDLATGRQYGRNIVRWKPDSVCATFFCGDSLLLEKDGRNYCACSLVTRPSPVSFLPENTGLIDGLKKGELDVGISGLNQYACTPFIELQMHGNPTAAAIESISFGSEADALNLSPDAIETIIGMGIRTYLGARRADLDESGHLAVEEGAKAMPPEEESTTINTAEQ